VDDRRVCVCRLSTHRFCVGFLITMTTPVEPQAQTPQLPSKQQLLITTAIALLVATIILVTTVLPAEYGVDPTGAGAALGLTVLSRSAKQPPPEPLPTG